MSGQSNLVVLLPPSHPEAAPQTHKDQDDAFAFLKDAARIKPNMVHFTERWLALRPKRFKDKEQKERDILRGLAGLLASDKLRVKSRERQGGGGTDEEAPPPPPPQRRKRALTSGGMKIRERPDPPPPAPPPPPISPAQQAKALKDAAESGAPFVEQCTDKTA